MPCLVCIAAVLRANAATTAAAAAADERRDVDVGEREKSNPAASARFSHQHRLLLALLLDSRLLRIRMVLLQPPHQHATLLSLANRCVNFAPQSLILRLTLCLSTRSFSLSLPLAVSSFRFLS